MSRGLLSGSNFSTQARLSEPAASSELGRPAPWLARHRVKLTAVVFLGALLIEAACGAIPRHVLDLSDPWVLAGSLLIVLGLSLRAWAAGVLRKKEELATVGPYSLMRHPLYAGSLAMMTGFAILANQSINFLLIAGPGLFSIIAAIRDEERFLSRKFGATWSENASRVGWFFPKRLGFSAAPWSLAQWRRNGEYNALFGTVIGWICFWAWRAYHA